VRIGSNIREIILRLNRVDAEVPEAIARSIAPDYWTPRLVHAASQALREQWKLERNADLRNWYEKMTPRIVATVMGQVFGGGAFYTMGIPQDATAPVTSIEQAAEYESNIRTPSGRYKKMPDPTPEEELKLTQDQENLNRVRQLILDWVSWEKRLTPEEQNEAPEKVAEKIEVILGLRPHETKGMARTQAMLDAAKEISRALQQWAQGEGESGVNPEMAAGMRAQGLSPMLRSSSGFPISGGPLGTVMISPEVAEQWLMAVMEAWVKLVMELLPGRVREELTKTFTKIKTELPL
jgi:hypothetical protein